MKTEKKIPFDLDTYNSGKYLRVETRDGNIVRIVCTDKGGIYPIIAVFDNEEGDYNVYKSSGFSYDELESEDDLFLIVESMETVEYFNIYNRPLRTGDVHDTFEQCKNFSGTAINRIKLTIAEDGTVSVENLGLPEAAVKKDEVTTMYANVFDDGQIVSYKHLENAAMKASKKVINRQKTTITNGKVKIELIGLDAVE